jgi:hydroxyacylglutathione hydrolase
MASAAEIAKRYFAALAAQDLDAAVALWAPGAVDRLVGQQELIAPAGITDYFGSLFEAFPDFVLEVLETVSGRKQAVVRWQATGTFAGPGTFQGLVANGARLTLEGCDVVTVEDDLIRHNDTYLDGSDIARQLGILPATGSQTEARLTKLANLRSRLGMRVAGAEAESIADGVWVVRGGFPIQTMNVYLIADDGGVTVFDAGIESMGKAVAAAAARLGGIKRVVLGHADADHRGTAPALGAPVYCHPAEREAAEADTPWRPYWDFSKLDPHGRLLLRKLLPVWDGGAVQIAGTVEEGEEIAGFRVVELPGHAPGLIGLVRESDRLALVSDCFYMLDPQTGRKGAARVPHPAFNVDTEQTRDSIRKLAGLGVSVAWAGHADPVSREVSAELERAGSAPL